MEINEQRLAGILQEQRGEFETHVDKKLEEQREKFETHVDQKLEEQREEYQRYLGVLGEHFDDQTKLIAESVQAVQAQLGTVKEMVAKNTEDIEIIKMDVGIIKNELKQKVDRDEFAMLEGRVASLEAKLNR